MKIRPVIAWYDMWIGLFWDRKGYKLYIFPIPCVGFVIRFRSPQQKQYESDLAASIAGNPPIDPATGLPRYTMGRKSTMGGLIIENPEVAKRLHDQCMAEQRAKGETP